MHSKLVRTPGLYLIGFMGCGKSTIGALLAEELGWHFADLDSDIEADTGSAIAKIFDASGEEEFRRLEHAALEKRVRSVRYGRPTVVALGGGAFTRRDNCGLIADSGVSIWLDCPLDRIRARVAGYEHRPLARDPARFEHLYHERQASYALADFRIEVNEDDPRPAVNRILALPLFD